MACYQMNLYSYFAVGLWASDCDLIPDNLFLVTSSFVVSRHCFKASSACSGLPVVYVHNFVTLAVTAVKPLLITFS